MARILVAGNINHDRVWHLDRPLVAGGRLSCRSREVRLGGGAYHTGSELLKRGHEVMIAGSLMDDETGRNTLQDLNALGFDTRHVILIPGETAPADILLDPSGQRTIIAPPNRKRPPATIQTGPSCDSIYVNAAACADVLLAAMRDAPLCLAQFPVREEARPADYLVGSTEDLVAFDESMLWPMAQRIAGTRLKSLIVTAGPDPVRLFNGEETRQVAPPERLVLTDTIGAGDIFAGNLLHALIEGLTPEAATRLACRLTDDRLIERQRAMEPEAPPP